VVRLLAHSGLRWSELAGLRTTSLDLLRKQLHIRQVTTRCGDKDYPKSAAGRRTVPLPSALVDELAAHLVGVERGRRVFVGARGAPLSNVNFRHRVWIPAVEAAGIEPRPTLHDLRHTAASWLVQSGVPLYDVMRFLGHESITTTMRYSHLGARPARPGAGGTGTYGQTYGQRAVWGTESCGATRLIAPLTCTLAF
jgi:integrase